MLKHTQNQIVERLTCISIAKPVILVCKVKDHMYKVFYRYQGWSDYFPPIEFHYTVPKENIFLSIRYGNTQKFGQLCISFPLPCTVSRAGDRNENLRATWSLGIFGTLYCFSVSPSSTGWRCLCISNNYDPAHTQGLTARISPWPLFFPPFT